MALTAFTIVIRRVLSVGGIWILLLLSMYSAVKAGADSDSAVLKGIPEHLRSRLCQIHTYGSAMPGAIHDVYWIVLNKPEKAMQFEEIPCAEAIVKAAWYYAMLTGDYSVSLSEVLDAGLIPYDFIPDNISLETQIYGPCLDFLVPDDLKDIGTGQWLRSVRNRMLEAFYIGYYYGDVRKREKDKKYTSPKQLEKISKFWTDPIAKKGVVVGLHASESHLVPLVIFKPENYEVASGDPRLEWQVEMLNVIDCPSLKDSGEKPKQGAE